MKFYAQLDENKIVIGISQLLSELSYEHMIEINDYDLSLLGKLYSNGKFIERE